MINNDISNLHNLNKDTEYIFCLDDRMPKNGWIFGCFLCGNETANTTNVSDAVYQKIRTNISSDIKFENCKIHICFYCVSDIKKKYISHKAIEKYCLSNIKAEVYIDDDNT